MLSRALLYCPIVLKVAPAALAMNNQLAREQDIVGLRLGQHVLVDDGTRATGMIKEGPARK
jgi:hypothetical protein